MKSIDEIQDEIIEEFSVFDDWMDNTFDGAVSIGNYVWYQCWSTDRRCI